MKKSIGFWATSWALGLISLLGLWSCNVGESGDTYVLRMEVDDSLAVESNLFKSIEIDLMNNSGQVTHENVFTGPYRLADTAKLSNLTLKSRIPDPLKVRITAVKNNGEVWVFTIKFTGGLREDLPQVHTPAPGDTLSPTRIDITSPATPVLYVGDPSHALSAKAEPSTAVQTVIWSVSPEDVAVLESGNKLKALKAGIVTVKAASTRASSVFATLQVTIKEASTVLPTAVDIKNAAPLLLTVDGPSVALEASVLPAEAKQEVKWTLPPNAVAVLEDGNRIKALQAGTVTLTASSTVVTSVFDTVQVTVQAPPAVLPTLITLATPSPLTLFIGAAPVALAASVTPLEASQNIIWTFDAPGVVEIVNNNQIKGLKAGTTKVTATSAVKSSVTAVLNVVVEASVVVPESLSLRMPTPMVLAVGLADGDLLWTVLPAASDQGVEWSSSDTTVAGITADNKVRPLKKGTAKITGKSKAKSTVTATFDVSVIVPVKVDAIAMLPKTLTLYTGGPEGKLTVTLTGSDEGAQYTLASSDAAVATVSAAGFVKGLAAGSAVITASVVGYPAITSACSVKVIKDSPVVTVSPNQNVAFNGEASFTVSVAPQAHGTTVEIKADMDGDSVFEQTVLNKETAVFKQIYTAVKITTVSFKVKDTEGNEETVTRKVTVGAPGAPVVTIVKPSKDTVINVLSLKIQFTIKDTTLKIDSVLDSTVTLIAGSNKVRAARKYAGGEGSDEVTVLVDNTPPTVTIDGPATLNAGVAAFTMAGDAEDLGSGLQTVTISGALSGNGTANVTADGWSKGSLTLAPGLNTLVATALDKAGNTKTASITVTLDNKKPGAPTFVLPTVTAVRAGPIKWTWTKANADGNGKFKAKLNGGAEFDVAAAEYSLLAADMDTGTTYSLVVKETDSVAGDGPWSAEKKVLYDSKKPDPSISVSLSATKEPTWTWNGNGGAGTFRWYFKATTPTYLGTGTTKSYKQTVPAGTEATYNLCVQEKDSPEWGEEWGAEKCASIAVDKKPPVITNVSVDDGFITSQQTPGLKIQYTVDGSSTRSETTCPLVHNNNDIANTCTITATDDAENTATVTRSVYWRKNVVFVSKSNTGEQDGTTWKTAIRELHTALNPSTSWPSGTEIWVAEGSYSHDPSGYELQVKSSLISVLGGFKSGAAKKNTERSPASNKSVITTAVNIDEAASSVTWDGFTHSYTAGSGIMYSINGRAAHVKTCTFSSKRDHIYSAIRISGTSIKITDCKFDTMTVQRAAIEGAGIVQISGTTITGLKGTDPGAGGMGPPLYINPGGEWTVTGCTFTENPYFGGIPYEGGESYDGPWSIGIEGASVTVSGSNIEGGKGSIVKFAPSTVTYGSGNTPPN